MKFPNIFRRKVAEEAVPGAFKYKNTKVGIAFSGGAARGMAHIGAIKAFEEAGLKFDFIAGTSVGALVGALWAAGLNYKQIYERAKSLRKKDIVNKKFLILPSSTTGLLNVLQDTIGDISFSELKTPFACVAVDLVTGDEIIFTKGKVGKAVVGSCAAPGYYQPVVYGKMHLADGGLQNNIPSDVPREFGCNYVVAVDVNSARGEGSDSLKITDVLMTSLDIIMKSNTIKGYINADIMIQPDIKKFKSRDLTDIDPMIELAYQATKERMPEILTLIQNKPKIKKSREVQYEDVYKAKIY